MKKYKLLSWVLSLVMALTVFSIPVSGYAAGTGDTYGIGWYNNEGEFCSAPNGESVDISSIGESNDIFFCVYEDGGWNQGAFSKIKINNPDPAVVNIGYYNQSGEYRISSKGSISLSVYQEICLIPQKAGTVTLSAQLFGEESTTDPIGTVSFTVIVSEGYGFNPYNEDGDSDYLEDGESFNLSDLEGIIEVCLYRKDWFGEKTILDEGYIRWKNSDPSVARLSYFSNSLEKQVIVTKGSILLSTGPIRIVPRKTGSLTLTADILKSKTDTAPVASISITINVAESDLFHYCLGWWGGETIKEITDGDTVSYSSVGFNDFRIWTDEEGYWEEYLAEKVTWHNSAPSVAKMSYYNDYDDYKITSGKSITLKNNQSIGIVPQSVGTLTLSADLYDDASATEPFKTLNVTVTISQEELDKAKYDPYIDAAGIDFADYDDKEVSGDVPELDSYNEFTDIKLTAADLDKLKITATIGEKTYKATIFKDTGYFYIKLPSSVALGSKVKVIFTMGTCSRTCDLLVTKYINPKVTAATYIYNGKTRKASVTVTYGGKTLKKGTDYILDSDSRKSVGKASFSVEESSTCKYRFYKDGFFKIKPKGSYITSLSGATKAATVKWKKQSEKMSTGRINGYQIQLATNSSFTKNKKWVKVKGYSNTSVKVTKLKAKTKYYVKVRTYKTVSGTTYYSSWSKAYTVTTK